MVSSLKIAAMAVSGVVGVALPLVLALIWRKRTGAKWSALFIGMAIFVVFVLVLENACHQIVLFGDNPVSAFVNSNVLIYGLYGAFAAGIFEETGRFVAFKLLLKKQNGKETGVMYGIGHGGVEAILICTVSMISNIAFSLSLNSMGADALLASIPAAQASDTAAIIESLQATSAATFLLSGVERILAVALHISLSVFVFAAVKRGQMKYYPIAILLHALVDLCAIIYQVGIIKSLVVLELIIAVMVACIAFWAVKIYKSDKTLPEQPAEALQQ